MGLYGAGCLDAAHPGARVSTLLSDTCKVSSTLRVGDTFRLTLNIRVANVI